MKERDNLTLSKKPTQEEQAMIDKALEMMKAAGYKNTKKRQEILQIFAQYPYYLKAQSIHQCLVKQYPTMSYNTIYRNLYDFVEVGILETTEFEQEQLFRYACHLDNDHHHHHHHHFICTECGMTIPLDICPMSMLETNLDDVEIESHRFEIFGLCQDCKKK